jgi:hypothetical protein
MILLPITLQKLKLTFMVKHEIIDIFNRELMPASLEGIVKNVCSPLMVNIYIKE